MWIVVEQALNKKQCVELSLSKNPGITVHGVSIIALALQTNTTLLNLSMTHNTRFSDESAEALARGLRTNRYLLVLDLSQNAIEDSGAEQLAEMLKVNKTLRDLDLTHNNIHNSGVKHLATALRQSNTTLERLSINWNPFADGCVNSLIEMLNHNRTLQLLEMLETDGVSDEARVHLREAGKKRLR
jgi:Ran GTPase-activating protein (RanGAP) involved in mRNA processing and transport